jgi:hypothetical protein
MAVAVALIGQKVKGNDYATMCENAISRQTHALLRLGRVMGQSEERLRPWGYVIELKARAAWVVHRFAYIIIVTFPLADAFRFCHDPVAHWTFYQFHFFYGTLLVVLEV